VCGGGHSAFVSPKESWPGSQSLRPIGSGAVLRPDDVIDVGGAKSEGCSKTLI